jgi:hypothetical protein
VQITQKWELKSITLIEKMKRSLDERHIKEHTENNEMF